MNNSKLSVPGQYEDESSTIYVGNIDSRLSDEEIIKHFSKYGQVESIFRRLLDSFYPKEKAKPFKPPKNGVQYGFVKFVNAESIEEVLKDAKGMTLGQRKLAIKARVVNPAKLTDKKFKPNDTSITANVFNPSIQNNTDEENVKPGLKQSQIKEFIPNVEERNWETVRGINSRNPKPETTLTIPSLGLEDISMQVVPNAFASTLPLSILNLPAEVTPIDLYNHFKQAGVVKGTAVSQFLDQRGFRYGEVIMDSVESCQNAIEKLNNVPYKGSILEVSIKNKASSSVKSIPTTPTGESLWPFPSENANKTQINIENATCSKMTWIMGSPTKEKSQWGSVSTTGVSNQQNHPAAWNPDNKPQSIVHWDSLRESSPSIPNSPIDPSNLYVKNLDDTVITCKSQLEDLFSPFGSILSSMLACYPNSGISKGYGFVAFRQIEAAVRAKDTLNGMMVGKKRIFVCFAERKSDRIRRLQAFFANKPTSEQTAQQDNKALFVKPERSSTVTIRKPIESSTNKISENPTTLSSKVENKNEPKTGENKEPSQTNEYVNCKQENKELSGQLSGNLDIKKEAGKLSHDGEQGKLLKPLVFHANTKLNNRGSAKMGSTATNLKKIQDMLHNKKLSNAYFVPRARATTCTTLTYVTVEPSHFQDEDCNESTNMLSLVGYMDSYPEATSNIQKMNSYHIKDSNKENFLSTTKVNNNSPTTIQLTQI
nr:Crp79 [Schizosaccharomyces pombe]